MPSKSDKQKRLMRYSYACKKGYTKDCPDHILKIGKSMSDKQLKDFFESVIYNTAKIDNNLLSSFMTWMDSNNVEYSYNKESGELEIYNETKLSRERNSELLQYISRLGLSKIWEDGVDGGGTHVANLGNVTGQGSARMGSANANSGKISGETPGSGDRWDNDEDDEDDEKKKKKHKKKKKTDESLVMDFKEFLHERLIAKRKYTEKYPEQSKNYVAPVRIKVLEFVSKKGSVLVEDMYKFFDTLEEDLGKKPNLNWLVRNADLVKIISEKNGKKYYILTKRGKNVLEKHEEFQKLNLA